MEAISRNGEEESWPDLGNVGKNPPEKIPHLVKYRK
jgi:hypothetical protein